MAYGDFNAGGEALAVDTTLKTSGAAADAKATGDALAGKAAASHTHDDSYYTESEVDAKLNGKANSSHTHDDRYYTESEMNTKLNGKANSSHTHDDRYYTESEMDTKLNGKANSSHTHNYAGSSSAGGTANSVNGFTFAAQTTDPGAGSSLTTNKILIVYV